MKSPIHRPTVLALAGLLLTGLQPASAAQSLETAPRNVQFASLSTEDGLSGEFVHDLVQDRAGFVWFATQTGLNRYGGHEVRVYEPVPDDERSLSHSFVWSLFVDSTGELWIGTDRGVNRYDAATDSFDRHPLGAEVSAVRVRYVTRDAGGTFWIGTVSSGLMRVDAGSGEVTRFVHEPDRADSLPSDHIIDIHSARDGTLWVATNGGGLARLDTATSSFRSYRHVPGDPSSLSDDHVRSIHEASDGRLWVGTADGLSVLDRSSGEFVRYSHDPEDPFSLGAGQVPSMYEDTRGTLWVGTEGGLSEWRPALNGFVTYRRDPADRKTLINDRVNTIAQDASGVLWLATHGGVSSWNYISDTFTYYNRSQDMLQSDVVTSMDQSSDGAVWVGTYGGGLTRLDFDTGSVSHYRHDANDPGSLGDDRVMTVHVDAADTVWVGTRQAGLARLEEDGRFSSFRHDPDDAKSLSGDAVSRVVSDRHGALWVGVFGGGLNRLSAPNEQPVFERFRHDPDDDASLSGDRVLSLFEDSAGALWVGTENAGLNRFVPETGSFLRFDVGDAVGGDGADPVDGTPWEMHETSDGVLWIGTLGQGLLRWSAADRRSGMERFLRYDGSAGLASDIYGVVEGGDGELWLSSSRGLFRFDPASSASRRFDRSKGLRNNEFNVGARLRTDSGRVLFGGTNGLVSFLPDGFPRNERPPAVHLVARSRTAVLGRTDTDHVPHIELGYLDPFVSFDFVALDFTSPDKNAYRFRLAGYDGDWNDAAGFRRAIYSNLPAGRYTFEVQASNSDGVWNRQGASTEVTVVPPPWRSRWAYLAYGLFLAASVLWLLGRQHRKHRQEAELRARLERLVNERTLELAERNEELVQLNERFQEASVTDQLTGLRNRRYVSEYIEEEVFNVRRRHVEARQATFEGEPRDSSKMIFIMMIDLDGFKPINDTFGHNAGDQALLEVKDRLVNCCRTSDVVVRWGGDEFLIVGRTASFDGAKVVAEKVRRTLADVPYDIAPGQSGRLSASIGIASIPFVDGIESFGSWEQIVAVVGHGAYLSKSNGRNAWVSLRGTELMTERDMAGMKAKMRELVDSGKLTVDSSIGDELSLDLDAPQPRRSIG